MIYIVNSRVVAVLALALLVVVTSAATDRMSDPYLGLTYDPAIVRFDPAPTRLVKLLHLDQGPHWVFASYADPEHPTAHYYIVAGLMPIMTDEEPPRRVGAEPDYGGIIVYRGGVYRWLGVAERLDNIDISERIVNGLAKDFVARVLGAYGGKAMLQAAINKEKRVAAIKPVARALAEAGITGVATVP